MAFQRYAVYHTPQGALGRFGADWLGWDLESGQPTTPPDIDGLPAPWDDITGTPRKYGFHATVKPPFRLADGWTEIDLLTAFTTHCDLAAPITLDGLELAQLGRFLALVPTGDTHALNALAADTVRDLDAFRAPLTDADLARRRASGLTPEQDALLLQWGYPYVMDQFRCHYTLSGKLPKAQAGQLRAALDPVVTPLVPQPFTLDTLSLCGEDAEGRFHLVHRATLSG
ncbi:hypothetical protein FIU89_16765 [Roseovarius sp. THAF27]|uniref:DUF1045 domain-containing protein n=1 Tax=Roseovarius sp. THAF27 TaxID=2587850 RepID=UPI001269679A|nr:DUF1045 domain-containing protein [Roseovarius sp. THAF27]QFT82280.1 hypothetical protein FIU89_16765 [Roseovarius sp. THAF27]